MKWFENIEVALFASLIVMLLILAYKAVIAYWGRDMIMRKVILHDLKDYSAVTGNVRFEFELLTDEEVTFTVLSADETAVQKIVDHDKYPSGTHQIDFDSVKLQKGWYWYRLETPRQKISKKFRVI